MKNKISEEKLISYFRYYDALRKTGVTNMFGASPYLRKEFKISENVSRDALSLWIKTFSEETLAVRAKEAFETQKGDRP